MQQNQRTKILYCEGNIDGTVGGSYYCLLNLVRGIDQNRYEPVIVFHFEHALMTAFREAGAHVILWPKPKPFTFAREFDSTRVLARFARPVALILQKAMNFIRRLVAPVVAEVVFIRRNRVKIIHLNNSVVYSHDWMIAARIACVRCITHERAMASRLSATSMVLGRQLDKIICVSEAVRQNMRQRGFDSDKLVTVYDGVDTRECQPRLGRDAIRATHGLDPAAPVVGMIGNIKEWKGQQTLIRALDRVRHTVPSVHCLLVGDTAPADLGYAAELRELISALGLESHVIFAGFQRHVADYLMAFDVAVVASTVQESFGMVVVEAMACKKPVIASRVGAIPEIIEDGVTGLMFSAGDVDSLAEAIVGLLGDPDRARRLAQSGFDRVVQHFGVEANVRNVEGIYRDVLSDRL